MNSPFIHFPSLELEKAPALGAPGFTMPDSSPFNAISKLNGKTISDDPRTAQFVQFVDELYDEEFEEAVEDLVNEASELYESYLDNNQYFNQEYQARQMVLEHYSPLMSEVDRFFDYLVFESAAIDAGTRPIEDLEGIIDRFEPKGGQSELEEQWLKKLTRKVKNVANKVKNVASKAVKFTPLGLLWGQLRKIVPKLLKWVLEKGISKLPEQYQSVALNLAKKYLPANSVPAATTNKGSAGATEQEPADPAELLQSELNAAIAYFMTTPPGRDWELMELELDQPGQNHDMAQGIDKARDAFVEGISNLKEGDEAEPHVEQFVGLITTGLKLGIRLIGRQKVINFISPLIAKLIGGLVGREHSEALAKHMVEAGLKLLNMEAPVEEASKVGASAVAATVEDTVRQMEHFPGYVFEDRQLLERYVVQAFEKAAAANLPDILKDRVYKERPQLRESNRQHLLWKMKKGNAKHQAVYKVKQLNEVVEAELTPYIANEVKTFGGTSLSTFLQDRLGVTVSDSLPVRIHMVEALPGSRPYHLSKFAAGLPGIDSSNRSAWTQFHPLTSIAAGLLLGEPGLGCRAGSKCLGKQKKVSGHRYYYLEIPGARPQYFQELDGALSLRHYTGVKTKLNFVANEIWTSLYLSEADGQAIATCLRKKQPETAHVLIMMAFEDGLNNLFKYGKEDGLSIVHPQVSPGKKSGQAMDLFPPVIVNALLNRIKDWVGQALIQFLREEARAFNEAVEDYSDGVTLHATIAAPPDFEVLRQILSGNGYSLENPLFAKSPQAVSINVKPGYRHD